MNGTKADIIERLQKDLLSLHGFKATVKNAGVDAGIGPIRNAFPNASFPLGAMHEFISGGIEDNTVTKGFVASILAFIMGNKGITVWISASGTVFPPALKHFGIAPERIIFINLQKEKEILWTIEEALKCKGISTVIGEIPELSFTASRRLQLAVEQSKVTGFILRNNCRNINTTACVTRWKITPLPSGTEDDLPGLGFPRWNVELIKVRNGYPGSWQVEFAAGRFRYIPGIAAIADTLQKKTG